ncbi:MAG: molybdopterin-dependent oxidoreductase [Bryobacterales bacterium]|nr:molybdopterin-dependent oxidoreductase [Bryobacterales bacterium]
MSNLSRRRWLARGLTAAAGITGIGAAAAIAKRHGLMPPDAGLRFGTGAALTYAAQRMLTRHSLAREFSRSQISSAPFANPTRMNEQSYQISQAAGFADWKLAVEGMVAKPQSIPLQELKSLPSRSQITQLVCEEGWSYIAEFTGLPLSTLLESVDAHPEARYVVYYSIEEGWWDSVDMEDAMHPQTLLAYGMNGQDLPSGFGGPLRMRVPRQLGYKSVKYINRLVLTDDLQQFGKGFGSPGPEYGYSWYAGI